MSHLSDEALNNDFNLVPNSIQIASDLHLEFPGTLDIMTKIEAKSPVLCLCGDICWPNKPDYKTFLEEMANKFEHVIVIAGNHEYYYQEYHETNSMIESIVSSISTSNVHFLQKSSLELNDVLPGIRILGTTLWIDYPKKTHKSYKMVVNDFQRIYFNNEYNKIQNKTLNKNDKQISFKRIVTDPEDDEEEDYDYDEDEKKEEKNNNNHTSKNNEEQKYPFIEPSDVNKLHKEEVCWLKNELKKAKNDGKKVVILTHHAPTDFACNGLDIKKIPVSYSTNYANLELLFDEPLIAWCWGHTHYNADFVVKTDKNWFVRCATNQMGYIYKRLAKYYLPAKVIKLYDNKYWIEKTQHNEEYKQNNHEFEWIVKFSETKKKRNVIEYEKELQLQVTMIDYHRLLKNINHKKNYVPKDKQIEIGGNNSKDCVIQ